jgi:hypothetical protein
MFTNTNYESKLSPTMTENWLVQIFKNSTSGIQTTDTPDLALSFASTTFDSVVYYPAILNKPSISYSLDLKNFTTNTGSLTLNIGNIDIDGTTLLGTLGKNYLNAHVNILSQIDNDDTAANALQIFSGKVSSFGYKNNTIIMNIISNRPFQNVSIPQGRTSSTNEAHNNKIVPLVYGDYTASTGKAFNAEVFKCPFHKNDGTDFMFLVPEGTSGSDDLEFYDDSIKRFLPLTDTNTTIADVDGAKVLKVPKSMKRIADVFPDEVPASEVVFGTATSKTAGEFVNIIDDDTDTSVTVSNSTGFSNDIGGFFVKLIMPELRGKITNLKISLEATFTQTYSNFAASNGLRVTVQDTASFISAPNSFAHCFGSPSRSQLESGTISITDVDITDYVTDHNATDDAGYFPDDCYLYFDFDALGGTAQYADFSATIKEVSFKITAENDLDKEPVASTSFNAGIDEVYLGRDILTESFRSHSTATTASDLNNPVAIHRQLLDAIIDVDDFVDDTDIEDSGFKTVAELRDSDTTSPASSTHWKTRFSSHDQEPLEKALNKLQYEGCFFFQFNPQAQQTALTGVSPLRYFTIDNGVPTADIALSQNDISGYELGITEVGDLETNLVINYKPHPAEDRYLKQATYTADTGSGQNLSHGTIFEQASHQKEEVNLDYLFDSVDDAGSDRNDDFVNFRSSLFGDYKTTINVTLVNPEKYGMIQVGDFIDFSSILFQDLGSPFDEISDTFDSFVAMPTNLFGDTWSNKRFIITNLKRNIGSVSIGCREV